MDILTLFPLAHGQLKFLIIGVYYLTKWIEVEAMDKIIMKRVSSFYWQWIMCQYRLPNVIASDNECHFASTIVIDFCKDLCMKTKFVFVIHIQSNGADKVILKVLKKKLDNAKGLLENYSMRNYVHTIPRHSPVPRKSRFPWYTG